MGKKKASALFILIVVILAIYIPKFICPINELDGAWYFSQAVSISHGSYFFNEFTHNYMPVLFGWIQAPIALLNLNEYSVFTFYLLASLTLGLLLFLKHKKLLPILLIPLLIVTDKTVLLNRPEPIVMLLTLLFYGKWKNISNPTNILLASIVMGVVLILIHPANGILAIASIFAYHGLLFQNKKTYLLIYFSVAFLAFISIYAFKDSIFIETLLYRIRTITITTPIKFITYSGITLIALLFLSTKNWNASKIINYLMLAVLCFILGAYYYFLFLFVPLLITIIYSDRQMRYNRVIWFAVVFNVAINLVHPITIQLENVAYSNQVNHINKEIKGISTSNKIFIESYFSPSSYFEHLNSRMILIDHMQVLPFEKPEKGDLILMSNANRKDKLYRYLTANDNTYSTQEIFSPVKGLKTLHSAYSNRTDSLGLWLIELK